MSAPERLRIDKWLWAARFFRTRAKAKDAIDGGKVHWEGQRTRPAKEVAVGDTLEIRQGFDTRTVIVRAIAERRSSAEFAATLYEETAASIEARERATLQRRAAREAMQPPAQRPGKHERRELERLKKRPTD